VDSSTEEEIRAARGTVTEPGFPTRFPRPHVRGEPGPLPPHARGRVPGRLARAARKDRPGVQEHAAARPTALPRPPRASLPHGRRVVHLPALRLRAPHRRRHRGDHALALHAGVRQQPRGLRLDDGALAGLRALRRRDARAAAPVRVRARRAGVHHHQQAQAPAARERGAGERVGRSAPPHARRDAPPRRDPRGAARVLRDDRRGEDEQPRGGGEARLLDPRRPEHAGAARPLRPEAAQGDDHQLPGRRLGAAERAVLAARRAPRRDAPAPLLARALHRPRRLRGEPAQGVPPDGARRGGAAAPRLHRPLRRGGARRRGRGRGAAVHVRSRHPQRERERHALGEGDDPVGVRRRIAPVRGAAVRPPLQRSRARGGGGATSATTSTPSRW
jgi:hypothetical protein